MKKERRLPKIEDFPEKYQEQIRKQIATEDRDSSKNANLELGDLRTAKRNKVQSKVRGGDVLKHKEKVQEPYISVPVQIRITFIRKTLTDFDGCIVKWILDAIVEAGVLRDDSQQFVKEVEKIYEKTDKEENEQTIVEVFKYE